MTSRRAAAVRRRLAAAARALRDGEPRTVPPHPHPKLTEAVRDLREQVDGLAAEMAALRTRVGDLDGDLLEQRALGLRIAELADVVAELLGEAARGDQARFRQALDEFAQRL